MTTAEKAIIDLERQVIEAKAAFAYANDSIREFNQSITDLTKEHHDFRRAAEARFAVLEQRLNDEKPTELLRQRLDPLKTSIDKWVARFFVFAIGVAVLAAGYFLGFKRS